MGNKNYQSTCPLINKRKLKRKNIFLGTICSLGVIYYKDKEFILVLDVRGKIEIYESEKLELIAKDEDSSYFHYFRYVGKLIDNYFVVVGQRNMKIYILFQDNNKYNIKVVQNIKSGIEFDNKYFVVTFTKALIFDRNLYRKSSMHDVKQENKKVMKDINKIDLLPINDELIIGTKNGVFLFKKENDNFKEINNKLEKKEEKKEFDIFDELEKWKKNPYICDKTISKLFNYDIIQVNYNYIAGTIENYLCLYSMETYELVTKFEVKTSSDCDCIIFMLNEDILCLGGGDSISLISIKNIEIILVSVIKSKFMITEICILPDFNILIGMQNDDGSDNIKEYFFQYKYCYSFNTSKKKMEHKLIKGSSKFLTKKESNIMMRCLRKNRLVIVVELNNIQIWE